MKNSSEASSLLRDKCAHSSMADAVSMAAGTSQIDLTKAGTERVSVDNIPRDILASIFSYLTLRARVTILCLVCKAWQDGARHRMLWEELNLSEYHLHNSAIASLCRHWLVQHDTSENEQLSGHPDVGLEPATQSLLGLQCDHLTDMGLSFVCYLRGLRTLQISFKNAMQCSEEGTRALLTRTNFPLLQNLDLQYSVMTSFDLAALPTLHSVKLDSCFMLQELSGIASLQSLNTLSVHLCRKLRKMQGISTAPLTTLCVRWCDALPASLLNDIGACAALTSLNIALYQLGDVGLEFVSRITTLRTLNPLFAVHEKDLFILETLPHLHTVTLYTTTLGLPGFKRIGNLASLRVLELNGSRDINNADLALLAPLTELDTLQIVFYQLITQACFQYLAGLPSLHTLKFSMCDALNGLQGVEQCKGLRFLCVEECQKVRMVTNAVTGALQPGFAGWKSLSLLPKLSDLKLEVYPNDESAPTLQTIPVPRGL